MLLTGFSIMEPRSPGPRPGGRRLHLRGTPSSTDHEPGGRRLRHRSSTTGRPWPAVRRGAYAVPLPFWRTVTDRAREAPGGLVLRRGHPRRLPVLRHRGRARLGHPVRAVEGDLELAQRRQPARAGMGPGRHNELLGTFAPHDLRRQPRLTRIASRLTDATASGPARAGSGLFRGRRLSRRSTSRRRRARPSVAA